MASAWTVTWLSASGRSKKVPADGRTEREAVWNSSREMKRLGLDTKKDYRPCTVLAREGR